MRRASWIGHPLTVLALVVLVVNDHLLKHTWPGVVTGKLSDVAGLILLPAVLDLALRRPWLSIAVTGAGFTLVKASETGAWLASEAWSLAWGPSVILADPTDLLTLPALYVAWLASRHPVPVGRTVVVLLTPAAVLAITATSIDRSYVPPAAYSTQVIGNSIIVHTALEGEWGGYVTTDGRTWLWWPALKSPPPSVSSCATGRCYRIVPGRLMVEEASAGDDDWTTSWELSEHVQDRLRRAHPADLPELVPPVESLSVSAVPGLVVVANGADGVAVRDASGTWRRWGLDHDGPDESLAVPVDAPGRYDDQLPRHAALVAIAAGLLVLVLGTRSVAFGIGAVALWAAAWGWIPLHPETGNLLFPMGVDVMVCRLALPPVAVPFVIFSAAEARPPWWVWPFGVGTGALTWLVVMAPFTAWSQGLVPTYSQATVLAVVFAAVTAATGAWVMIRSVSPRRR
ncbi:hypothetical protein [Herbidospora sp. NBRC 101105]|uniref:hypothetical protein n=1 Tax=Herbidospora sp. NBRC 101105 TaxID=3032195 RepID=UPI0024A19A7F|nr:hypothetical protein [Herbidospora sp. NBRC 101105]GLX95002.1 hypothetical protein Hesp01_29520 [Herbidospora sp. NBRC 101105]